MKPILFLTWVICTLFVSSLQAQQQTTPTRQETIDWIAGKLAKYPNGDGYKSVTLDEDRFTIDRYKTIYKGIDNNILTFEVEDFYSWGKKSTGTQIDDNYLFYYKIDLEKLFECDTLTPKGGIRLFGNKIFKHKKMKLDVNGKYLFNGRKYSLEYDWKEETQLIFFQWGHNSIRFIDFQNEPNLKERITRAFQLLAKYNVESLPKEKF